MKKPTTISKESVSEYWEFVQLRLRNGNARVPDATSPRARQGNGRDDSVQERAAARYTRRTREVDEAILGTYLSGANSRRVRKVLKPLLGEEHLSKSAVSRVVSRLKERFEEWQNRDLSEEVYTIVYLDGFHMKVRMAKRVISVPSLAALGVAPDGQKRLLSLRLAVAKLRRIGAPCWRDSRPEDYGLPS